MLGLTQELPHNMILMSVLSMALVSMVLVISQSPAAYAGFCAFPGPDEDCDGDGFTPNQGDCEDQIPSIYPGEGCPIPPEPAVQAIIADVDAMVTSGDLEINHGEANAIFTKLNNAIDKFASGNTNAAIGALKAFINQINAFINAGAFSDPNDGRALIDAAQSIIGEL